MEGATSGAQESGQASSTMQKFDFEALEVNLTSHAVLCRLHS